MATFNIENFKANLIYGIATPSRYEVQISSPSQSFAPSIGMFAEEAEIPGKSFATQTMGWSGPAISIPYRELYTDLSFTFICSADFYERKFFEEWQRKVVNPLTGYFGYYNSYIRNISVKQLDQRGNTSYEGIAIDAWPLTIENQELGYRKTNDYHRLVVRFVYTRFLDINVYETTSRDSGVGSNLTPNLVRNNPNPESGPGSPVKQ